MNYPTTIKGCNQALAARYSLALLDLDGVVYRGAQAVEYAAEGITAAAQCGMRIAYTTNNPSRYPDIVADQISSFGVEAHGSDVITSAMVSAAMLSEKLPHGARVLVIGKDHLKTELSNAGLAVVDSAADQPDAVIQSWFPELAWNALAEAAYAIENGAQYFVTNRDLTLPRAEGIAPGNGAMQLPVIAATGQEPIASAGKPESAMYHQARHLFSPTDQMVETQDCLPVGDRLDTDIEAANRGGYDSVVVLTGVADAEQIMRAEPIQRPTYICSDLRGLSRTQPYVRWENGQAVCGDTCAWVENAKVHVRVQGKELTDNISSLDALRSAASAAWSVVDAGECTAAELITPGFTSQLFESEEA
ncbi:HAD-IIA family hydrolase [Alloscardovia omnicolens]|uniref:HAD-IIA family hydrolase n=1 Tax=Alloscardovia omnicolens TaxID=419015 RepID=UPI003A7002C8